LAPAGIEAALSAALGENLPVNARDGDFIADGFSKDLD
jgi:hypothetical protein